MTRTRQPNQASSSRSRAFLIRAKVEALADTQDAFVDTVNAASGKMHAPFNQEPSRDDNGAMCLLTSSHYIVSGSIGLVSRRMRPHHISMDTGCGPKVIRKHDLPLDWERHLIDDDDIPALGDANGNPLSLLGKIILRVPLGSATYRVAFVIAEHLAVSVIIGTSFMNKNVKGIMCIDQMIHLTRFRIPILAQCQRDSPYVEMPAQNPDTDHEQHHDSRPRRARKTTRSPRDSSQNVNCPHTIKLAKHVTLPPMFQLAVPVISGASGLVFIEPKHSVQARYHVRTANGIAEVKKREKFMVVLSNFSKSRRRLPKNMTIAYATRSPLAIYSLTDHASREIENVLNIPFIRTEDDPNVTQELPESTPTLAPHDEKWTELVDLSQIEDQDTRDEITNMLTRRQDMWCPGKLGKIGATFHRIELEP